MVKHVGSEVNGLGRAFTNLVVNIVLVAIVLAGIDYLFREIIPALAIRYSSLSGILALQEYQAYVMVLVGLGLGWLIVISFSNAVYHAALKHYGRSGAVALRNLVRIIGLGAMLAAVAGGVAGGATGVALGGFIGMVVGFASQQVLGQAIAGLFLLVARPFKIGDRISAAKEDMMEVVEITTLFTIGRRPNGDIVLVPNNSLIGQKIVIFHKEESVNLEEEDK